MGLFSRKKKQTPSAPLPSPQSPATERDVLAKGIAAEPAASASLAGPALTALALQVRQAAEGQVTLKLTQEGQEMGFKFYQRGQELDSGEVLPGGDWYQVVADFFTEEADGDRGRWDRALIVANPPVGQAAEVQVSVMNTKEGKAHNLTYRLLLDQEQLEELVDPLAAWRPVEPAGPAPSAAGQQEDEAETAQAQLAEAAATVPDVAVEEEEKGLEESAAVESAQAPASEEEAAQGQDADRFEDSLLSRSQLKQEQDREPDYNPPLEAQNMMARVSARFAHPETVQEETSAEDAASSEEAPETQVSAAETQESESQDSSPEQTPLETSPEAAESAPAPEPEEAETQPEQTPLEAPAAENKPQQIFLDPAPASSSSLDQAPLEAGPEASEPAPETEISQAQQEEKIQELDLPEPAAGPDLPASYAQPAPVSGPSQTKKAQGNLVLTEAQVVSHLAPAYEALFGPQGSARDVSSVLIRVRTLGSYYDALTHVRRDGAWEQVPTFDLIPEEALGILQLKADSYKEGQGSPLAMNIRFTPGIPVEVSFDYQDEEAFVRYPQHLPAQQYVEELRMFPRTGAQIPAHMNEALASWTF